MVREAVINTRSWKVLFALFFRWVRRNLGIGTFLIGLLSSCAVGIVTGTLRVSGWDHRLDVADTANIELKRRVDLLDSDRKERDDRRIRLSDDLGAVNQRIDTMTQRQTSADVRQQAFADWVIDAGRRRIDNATALGSIDSKVAVLESQMGFLSGFVRDNTTLAAGHGLRK
jgi:hypothetical protein